jgi:hypothetical protein
MRKILSLFIAFLLPVVLFAQQNDVEMADTMRSNGKIYVVVCVISVILAGIIIFLITIDKKVRKLENRTGQGK